MDVVCPRFRRGVQIEAVESSLGRVFGRLRAWAFFGCSFWFCFCGDLLCLAFLNMAFLGLLSIFYFFQGFWKGPIPIVI